MQVLEKKMGAGAGDRLLRLPLDYAKVVLLENWEGQFFTQPSLPRPDKSCNSARR